METFMTTKNKIICALSAFLAFFSAQYVLISINTFGRVANTIPQFWGFIVLAIIGPFTSYFIAFKENITEESRIYKYRYTWIAIAAYYVFVITASIVGASFGITTQTQANQNALNELLKYNAPILVTYMTVIAPILEEVIFRHIIPKRLSFGTKNDWFGYVIGFILFLMLHSPQGVMGYITYGGMALMFTFMRIYYNNINASILTHITWNSIIVLIMYIN